MNIHADLIEQYAQDWKETDKPWERWEILEPNGDWGQLWRHPEWHCSREYRRKPRTFMVGDVEVTPVQEAPKRRQTYYTASPDEPSYYRRWEWNDSNLCRQHLERGLIHLNKEDAIAHGKALAALTGGE